MGHHTHNLSRIPHSVIRKAGLVPNGLFVSIAIAYALAAVRILRYGALVSGFASVAFLARSSQPSLTRRPASRDDDGAVGSGARA